LTVVFAGGGTGGHLYPAIAIADALRERAARIAFIGTADRLESTIVPKAGYTLHTIAGRALPRRPSFAIMRTVAANVRGTWQSLRLLNAQRPDLIVATGGYVAFPVALAARIRRIIGATRAPLVLLEPNVEPGLTNRLLTPIVDEVWSAQTTGVPIRAGLRRLPLRDDAIARLALQHRARTLLVMGGSQGARSINDALLQLLAAHRLPAGWQVLHVAGEGDYDRVAAALKAYGEDADRPAVIVRPYLDNMADAYAAADLVLTRAGASTLGELAALGKPAILVPYPFATHAHQAANAARIEAAGAAVVLTDEQLRAGELAELLELTVRPDRLAMLAANASRLKGSDAVAAILARIDSLLGRKNERS
jgi:UDP-N-acetylglucosamine--N-acetylmuramyl-(pentapeptide) pyrophosphoryl-undecaprenol N-acetylglucosamine transferase